jgi:hypothetical protein
VSDMRTCIDVIDRSRNVELFGHKIENHERHEGP